MPGIAGVIGTEKEAKTLLKHISNSIKKIVTGNNPIHAGSMLRKKHFEEALSISPLQGFAGSWGGAPHFDFDTNAVVLDAGCGAGYYSRLIASKIQGSFLYHLGSVTHLYFCFNWLLRCNVIRYP